MKTTSYVICCSHGIIVVHIYFPKELNGGSQYCLYMSKYKIYVIYITDFFFFSTLKENHPDNLNIIRFRTVTTSKTTKTYKNM